ncbi:hypothetical protein PENTCL1PPCAC_20331, partial [Pristionchus entomophagus]
MHQEELELADAKLACIHRGKAIYVKYSGYRSKPIVRQLSDDVLLLEIYFSSDPTLKAMSSSPFVYFCNSGVIETFETDTMKFLPSILFDDEASYHFIGVHNGVISIKASRANAHYIMKAQLPIEYYEHDPAYELRAAVKKLLKRNEEV